MKPALFQTMCFVLGGLLFLGVARYVPIVGVISGTLEAAIGSLPYDSVRMWQRQGGFTRGFSKGMRGSDVLLVQRALATDRTIYPEGLVTGFYGGTTKNAVMRFQSMYNLPSTGNIDTATRQVLNNIFLGELCPSPAQTEKDLWLTHVSRDQGLPQDYIPHELVSIVGRVRTLGIMCVTEATAEALQKMFADAAHEGILLNVCSGYRGNQAQGFLFQQYTATEGDRALREVALPYHSEHQLGTAVDLAGATDRCATPDFGGSVNARWLSKNAWKYGFNLSYPESVGHGKQAEYIYEPWHWRYVGTAVAAELHHLNISYNEIDSLQAALFSLSTATTTARAVQ